MTWCWHDDDCDRHLAHHRDAVQSRCFEPWPDVTGNFRTCNFLVLVGFLSVVGKFRSWNAQMVCSRQSIGWGGLWRSCYPSCQIFGAVRSEPKLPWLSTRTTLFMCSWLLAHRRQTTKKKDHPNVLPVLEVFFFAGTTNCDASGLEWLRSPISINQESEDNIELLPLYHVDLPCVTLCTLSLSCQTTLTKRQKKKKKKKIADVCVPQSWPRWVTHESRSSAASNPGLIRIGTQPRTADAWHQWLMPAARRRHPRFFGHFWPSVWPSSCSNFDLGPSPLDSTEKNLSYQSLWFWSAVFL